MLELGTNPGSSAEARNALRAGQSPQALVFPLKNELINAT